MPVAASVRVELHQLPPPRLQAVLVHASSERPLATQPAQHHPFAHLQVLHAQPRPRNDTLDVRCLDGVPRAAAGQEVGGRGRACIVRLAESAEHLQAACSLLGCSNNGFCFCCRCSQPAAMLLPQPFQPITIMSAHPNTSTSQPCARCLTVSPIRYALLRSNSTIEPSPTASSAAAAGWACVAAAVARPRCGSCCSGAELQAEGGTQ